MKPGYEYYWKSVVKEDYSGIVLTQVGKVDTIVYNPNTGEVTAVFPPPIYEVVLPDGMIVGVY